MVRRSTAAAAFAVAGQFGLCSFAVGTTTTGGIDVVVRVQPSGCQFTSPATTPGSPLTLSLVCSGNLFVEVQPTVLSVPASATTATAAPSGAFLAAGTSSADARPATELSQSIASLINTSDTRTSVGGAVFVQRRSSVDATSGLASGSSELTLDFGANSANTTAASPQPREILLIF